jgi:hypothetical protein
MKSVKIVFLSLILILVAASVLKAQVKFSGYFSFEYLKSQPEGVYPDGTFENLFGGLLAAGTISDRLSFLTEVQLRLEENFSLRQAYLAFQGGKLANIQFGLFEIPFGRFNRRARPSENLTVLRPLVFHFFPYRWNDLGICWEGNYSIFYYSSYVVNGLSAEQDGYLKTTVKDINKDKGAGGRLGLRFGEGFEVGGSFYSGKYDSDGSKTIKFEGVDLIWVTPEWEVRGEYIKAIYDHPDSDEQNEFDGYYLTVSLTVKSFRPFFSYQSSSVPEYLVDDENAPSLSVFIENMVKKTRLALGFKWEITGNFFAKFEYDWNKEKDVSIKDNALSVQLGFVF